MCPVHGCSDQSCKVSCKSSGHTFTLDDCGCEACSSPEIYHMCLEETISGRRRLLVKWWVECRCSNHRKAVKCDEMSAYYVKQIPTPVSTSTESKRRKVNK